MKLRQFISLPLHLRPISPTAEDWELRNAWLGMETRKQLGFTTGEPIQFPRTK